MAVELPKDTKTSKSSVSISITATEFCDSNGVDSIHRLSLERKYRGVFMTQVEWEKAVGTEITYNKPS